MHDRLPFQKLAILKNLVGISLVSPCVERLGFEMVSKMEHVSPLCFDQ